jgi:hypothetical protein
MNNDEVDLDMNKHGSVHTLSNDRDECNASVP